MVADQAVLTAVTNLFTREAFKNSDAVLKELVHTDLLHRGQCSELKMALDDDNVDGAVWLVSVLPEGSIQNCKDEILNGLAFMWPEALQDLISLLRKTGVRLGFDQNALFRSAYATYIVGAPYGHWKAMADQLAPEKVDDYLLAKGSIDSDVFESGASGYLVGTGFISSPPQWK